MTNREKYYGSSETIPAIRQFVNDDFELEVWFKEERLGVFDSHLDFAEWLESEASDV